MHSRYTFVYLLLLGASCQCILATQGCELDQNPQLGDIPPESWELDSTQLQSLSDHAHFTRLSSDEGCGYQSSSGSTPSSTAGTNPHSGVIPSLSRTPVYGQARCTASSRPPDLELGTYISVKGQILLQRRHHYDERPNPMTIAFAILGAFVGLIVLILLGRTLHHYYCTPPRDLVADHIDRFNLEKELAELEEARLGMVSPKKASFVQPPPPYQEAPKYEDSTKYTRAIADHPQ